MSDLELLKTNRQLADKLGWQPSDFGAARFDAELVEAIRAYQTVRFLKVTGLADEKAILAMRALEKAAPDIEATQRRMSYFARMGRLKHKPGSRTATRSAPFVGTTWYLREQDLAHDLSPYLTHCANIAIPPDLWGEHEWPAHLRQLPWIRTGLADPWRTGDVIGEWLRSIKPVGAIVELAGEEILEWGGDAVVKFHHARMAKSEVPMAIASAICQRARKMKRYTFAHFKALVCFDVGIPLIPGAFFPRQPMEFIIGESMAEFHKVAKQAVSCIFPAFEVRSETTTNHIHRFRAWLKSRSIRGCGWRSGVAGQETMQAFFGSLPSTIRRIDYL